MTSKLNSDAPKFHWRCTPTEWRSVDLATTKNIARRCSSGMDFVGCSKALVYECIAKGSSQYNAQKFSHLMHAAARISKRLDNERYNKLNNELNHLSYLFDQQHPRP